jgi:hypothetical protein
LALVSPVMPPVLSVGNGTSTARPISSASANTNLRGNMSNPDLEPGATQKGYRPRDAAKQTRKQLWQKLDRAESEKVKARSGGRCEVRGPHCGSTAVHVHHKLSGRGVRGKGKSALAENKVHVCAWCHFDIHIRRLVEIDGTWRRVE